MPNDITEVTSPEMGGWANTEGRGLKTLIRSGLECQLNGIAHRGGVEPIKHEFHAIVNP
jgi:hypothetical protein